MMTKIYLGRESEDPNPPGPGDLPLGSSLGGGGGPRRLGPVPKMLVFGFRPVEGLLPRSCKVSQFRTYSVLFRIRI